jgi:hypothetical protein
MYSKKIQYRRKGTRILEIYDLHNYFPECTLGLGSYIQPSAKEISAFFKAMNAYLLSPR